MEEIARLDHVYQYNELMGIETLHRHLHTIV